MSEVTKLTKFTVHERLDYIKEHLADGVEPDWNEFHTIARNMMVFKKTKHKTKHGNYVFVIVNLIIPVGTRIYIGSTIKCRAAKAFVHSQTTLRGAKCDKSYPAFFGQLHWNVPAPPYITGATYIPDKFELRNITCGGGIHFFTTLNEAYYYST